MTTKDTNALARLDVAGALVRQAAEKTLVRLKVTAKELKVSRAYLIGMAVEFDLEEADLETVVHMRREFGAGLPAVRLMLRRNMSVDGICELYRAKQGFQAEFTTSDAWLPSLTKLRRIMDLFSELSEMDGDEVAEQLSSAIREVNRYQEPAPRPPALVIDDLMRVGRQRGYATLEAAAEYLCKFETRSGRRSK